MNNMDNKTSIIKKQKTFLNDLANHHEDGDDRHMSFGTNMPSTSVRAVGKTMKSRKTVKFIDNEIGDNDMEFDEGQNYGDEDRRKSMDKYFSKASGNKQGKVRGFTMIKNLLVDFENDSDFLVSMQSKREIPNDMAS